MIEQLGVTPSELRATARYLADVSSRMKEVHSSLERTLSAEGQAWGHDEIGDAFANGSQGYLGRSDWVMGSMVAQTDLLDSYAQSLEYTADTFEHQDSTWT
jgi:uncharacterized protein YukE